MHGKTTIKIFYLNYLTLKRKALQYFATLGTTQPTLQLHMLQDLQTEQHLSENAKSRTLHSNISIPGVNGNIIFQRIFKQCNGGGVEESDVAEIRNKWPAVVNTVMNRLFVGNSENYRFSRLTLLHAVGYYKGADKSLARPGRKQATATEDFEFHISYL